MQRPRCVPLCTWRRKALTHLHRASDLEGRCFDWQCPPPPPPTHTHTHTHTHTQWMLVISILSRGASSVPYFLAFLDLRHSTRATKPSAVNFYFLSIFVSASVSLSPPPHPHPHPHPVSLPSTELLPDNKRLPRRNLVVIRVRFVRYRLVVGPPRAGPARLACLVQPLVSALTYTIRLCVVFFKGGLLESFFLGGGGGIICGWKCV